MDEVYVPPSRRAALEPVRRRQMRGDPGPEPLDPRYEVDLAFGRRLEPWVAEVRSVP